MVAHPGPHHPKHRGVISMFTTTNISWRGRFSLLPRPPPGIARADNGFSCAPLAAPARSRTVPGWSELVDAIALGAIGCVRTRAGSNPVPGTKINLSKRCSITQPSALALCSEGVYLRHFVSRAPCARRHRSSERSSENQIPRRSDVDACG
jgi:hypothetical protein